jgi:hypothetical protein
MQVSWSRGLLMESWLATLHFEFGTIVQACDMKKMQKMWVFKNFEAPSPIQIGHVFLPLYG